MPWAQAMALLTGMAGPGATLLEVETIMVTGLELGRAVGRPLVMAVATDTLLAMPAKERTTITRLHERDFLIWRLVGLEIPLSRKGDGDAISPETGGKNGDGFGMGIGFVYTSGAGFGYGHVFGYSKGSGGGYGTDSGEGRGEGHGRIVDRACDWSSSQE